MLRLHSCHVLLVPSFYVFVVLQLVESLQEILLSSRAGFFEFDDDRVFNWLDVLNVFGRDFVVDVLLVLWLALHLRNHVCEHPLSIFLMEGIFQFLLLLVDMHHLGLDTVHRHEFFQISSRLLLFRPIQLTRNLKFCTTGIFLDILFFKVKFLMDQVLNSITMEL